MNFFFQKERRKNRNYKNLLVRLGSVYGGWIFLNKNITKETRILSLGAGEDISFDVEIANTYGCYVDIYDPTPRSVEHFKLFEKKIGKRSSLPYSRTGFQLVESYSSENLSGHLKLYEKAVWTFNGEVKFYLPNKTSSVSHSITGFNSSDLRDKKYINVKCIDILDILIEKYQIIKLDIEGAEIDVLLRLIENRKYEQLPSQILVEFDELQVPKLHNYLKVASFNRELQNIGFKLVAIEKFNFIYCKQEII